ncbi:MAG: tetraacyldisaccharide 4'-kinase [candidate division Zixibacteria bacterium RBG_16_48_11]|nr:MAG: tetraacyldisaccharide 4'-kinase [candidate division Zixibacteria bacterium RBG_16_48_11]
MLFQRLDNYLQSSHRPKLIRQTYFHILRFLSWLFFLGYWFRRGFYRFGFFQAVKLNTPVISVGNLTWGGTGKTPFVIYLASKLEESGQKVVILTRGYKRRSKTQILLITKNLSQHNWQDCGDEPHLICQSLKETAVIINPRRAKAAGWGEENLKPDVFILDDGFQHWKLARDLDLVLVDSTNPFGNRHLLPLGILREPLGAISRADLVVLSKVLDVNSCQEVKSILNPLFKGEIIQAKYRFSLIREQETGRAIPLESLRDKRILAFCGIGNPESFYLLLEKSGLKIEKKCSFPDHYPYARLDLLSLEKEGLKVGVDYLATTAKDGLKIPSNLQLKLPVLIFEIEVEIISGEKTLWQKIEQILQR